MADQVKLEKGALVKLDFNFPDDLKSYFSDNFTVQHQKDHFILSFFEVLHPIIVGTEEDQISQINDMKKVDAKCVARILITPGKLKDIIKALNENYSKFEGKQKKKD